MTVQKIVQSIPHDIREQLILEWIPNARATMADPSMQMLMDLYFIYVDPNGVRKDNCPRCVNNVLENWRAMQPDLVAAEKEYMLLNEL